MQMILELVDLFLVQLVASFIQKANG